jgi:hypothetical protein
MKTLSSLCVAAALVVIAVSPASGDALGIFGSRVTRMIVEEVGPQFERTTGHYLVVVTDVAAVMNMRCRSQSYRGDGQGRIYRRPCAHEYE